MQEEDMYASQNKMTIMERIKYLNEVRIGRGYVYVPVTPIREGWEVEHKVYTEVYLFPKTGAIMVKLFTKGNTIAYRTGYYNHDWDSFAHGVMIILSHDEAYDKAHGIRDIVNRVVQNTDFRYVREQRRWLTDYEKSVAYTYFTCDLDEDWLREKVNLDEIEDAFSRFLKETYDGYDQWCTAMVCKRAAFMQFLKSRRGLKWVCEEMRKCANHERDLIIGDLDEESLWIYYQNHEREFIGLLHD